VPNRQDSQFKTRGAFGGRYPTAKNPSSKPGAPSAPRSSTGQESQLKARAAFGGSAPTAKRPSSQPGAAFGGRCPTAKTPSSKPGPPSAAGTQRPRIAVQNQGANGQDSQFKTRGAPSAPRTPTAKGSSSKPGPPSAAVPNGQETRAPSAPKTPTAKDSGSERRRSRRAVSVHASQYAAERGDDDRLDARGPRDSNDLTRHVFPVAATSAPSRGARGGREAYVQRVDAQSR
jgi:hypothetical protein